MDFILDPVAVRILGCLIEKETTTPDYYPMSLNALVNACNQKSNREPVMELSEVEIECGIETLRQHHLVWQRSVSGARVYKYEHNIKSVIHLSESELALMCTLMLRGAQTVGELRSRSERLHTFDSIEDAEKKLQKLICREEGALVLELPRLAGRKEPRYIHLLSGEEWARSQSGTSDEGEAESSHGPSEVKTAADRIKTLEGEVAMLKKGLAELRDEFNSLKNELE